MSVTANLTTNVETITATIVVEDETIIAQVSAAPRGPAGEAGAAGPNAVTSATTSNGTADLDLLNVETVTATVTDTLTAPHIHGNLAGSVYAHIRAGEALEKGDPVYVSGSFGSGSTLIAEVSKADASNAAKMPAIGIMDEDVANNATGHMVITGTITELDTAGLTVNAELYVAAGGGMTATPPTARAQPVARVERVNANNGAVIVKVNGLSASDATGNTLVRRTSGGGASFAGVTLSGTGGSPFTSTLTGGINFANRTLVLPDVSGTLVTAETLANSATITASTAVAVDTIVLRDGAGQINITNSNVAGTTAYASTAGWTYAGSAASAHRTALGLGATGSIAASDPLTVTQTWTNAAVTYTGLQVNVTDSGPSNAASLLMDLRVGGVSRASVRKDGRIFATNPGYNQPAFSFASLGGGLGTNGTNAYIILTASEHAIGVTNAGALMIGLNADALIFRDASGTLAQRNGTAQQESRIYGTYTGAGDYRRLALKMSTAGVAQIVAEGAGSGAAGNMLLLHTGNNIITKSADFTLAETDAATYMRLTKTGSTQTITLPTTGISTGAEFQFYRATTQALAFAGSATVNGTANLASVPNNGAFALKHLGSGTYDFI